MSSFHCECQRGRSSVPTLGARSGVLEPCEPTASVRESTTPDRRFRSAKNCVRCCQTSSRRRSRANGCGSGQRADSKRRSLPDSIRAAAKPRIGPSRLANRASTSGAIDSRAPDSHETMPVPGVETQQRFGGAGRTRIKRTDLAGRRVVEEKRHVDRHQQAVPLVVGDDEVDQQPDIAADPAIAAAGRLIEQQGAGIAGAGQPASRRLDQMLMFGGQRSAAQLAMFDAGRAR